MSISIQRRNSNSQPSDCESPPLTTRPELPPIIIKNKLQGHIFFLQNDLDSYLNQLLKIARLDKAFEKINFVVVSLVLWL